MSAFGDSSRKQRNILSKASENLNLCGTNWRVYWSRRITDEHRLVYKVTDESIIIASCRYHC